MQLLFIYGPIASGKLTVARALAARTNLALFHNHLVVDALAAVFPFGSEAFVRLREQFWLDVLGAAAREGRSLIFTFAPEPTVDSAFPERVRDLVQSAGGAVTFVELTLPPEEQERRLTEPDRAAFGKMRSVEFLRSLRANLVSAMAGMPTPSITIDTGAMQPDAAAEAIIEGAKLLAS